MVSIKLKDVTKRFGKVVAVKRINLTIDEGKLYVLLGPSGGGKSTLLYLIAGIYKPTEGRIFFDDKDVTDLPPAQRNVGLVFQNYALYPHMTVYENIAFPLKLKKVDPAKIDQKVREVTKFLHIEQLLDRYPTQLSGGQQQRVALARALVKEPSVLLLDEPLSNLDALLRIYIRAELKRIQQELGITTVYVTHDQSEAMAIADKIVVINKGVIQQIDEPDEIYDNPRNVFVATFIGNPPTNIVPGTKAANRPCVSVFGSEVCFDGKLADKLNTYRKTNVLVAFRPENVLVSKEPIDGALNIKSEIYELEPLGRETIITLTPGAEIFIKAIAQQRVSKLFKLGEEVYAVIKQDRIKIFDPETEINIEYL